MSPVHRSIRALSVAAAVSACLHVAQAANCPLVWSPLQTVRPAGGALNIDPQVGVDAAGWAMAAWTEVDADNTEHIFVSRRPPQGEWGAPHEVAQTTSSDPFNSDIDLAVGTGGHALLTWRRQNLGQPTRPWVASFDPAAGWSEPVDLLVPGETWMYAASVAVNARGEGVVSWLASQGVYTRVFQPASGWSDIHRGKDWKIDLGAALETRVAINDAGQAIVAWESIRPRAMRFEPTTGWQAPQTLFDHGQVDFSRAPEVAITPAGDAFVTWGEEETKGGNLAVFVSHFSPGQGWAAAERLTGPNYSATTPDVGVNAQGQALVAWNVVRPRAQARLEGALYRPGSGWGPAVRFTPAGTFGSVEAELSNSGLATVTSLQWLDGLDGVLATYTMRPSSSQSSVTVHDGLGPNNDAAGQRDGGLAVSGVDWSAPLAGEGKGSPSGALQARVRERNCH